MRVRLPDVNVLVALAWPTHVHHGAAREWFASAAPDGWATCPITQCGFVRVSSNTTIISDAASPADAVALLRALTQIGRHEFWPDDLDLTVPTGGLPSAVIGHRQVTDSYLLSLAIQHGGILSTLDRAISDLLPGESPNLRALEILQP